MAASSSYDSEEQSSPERKKKKKPLASSSHTNMNGGSQNNTTAAAVAPPPPIVPPAPTPPEYDLRLTQLEQIVARQEVEIRKLRKECNDLTEAALAFARVVELLRQAGLGEVDKGRKEAAAISKGRGDTAVEGYDDTDTDDDDDGRDNASDIILENLEDDEEIFGTAPSSVIDAADAAGAAILAGMLGGKQRMLVDVRDAELSRDAETLVQFVELAILPVAAGLEGLRSTRNRVKIVFPTVSQLLEYRRSMALAAPEVVALSTLGFDPVEEQDKLVVIVAPAPDDEEGLSAMNELLEPSEGEGKTPLHQPVVVINHHMLPVSGPAQHFEVAYHLRLLSVSFMSHGGSPGGASSDGSRRDGAVAGGAAVATDGDDGGNEGDVVNPADGALDFLEELQADMGFQANMTKSSNTSSAVEDELLEAAMKHAHEIGINQGVTRAMVIRAYPKPWHVFVDISPDTDADFVVAATFDGEPTQEDINFSIVECLEGSDREDELVAQQMQQALEAGQLDRIADVLGVNPEDVVSPSLLSAYTEEESEEQKDEGIPKGHDAEEKDNDNDSSTDSGGNFYNDFDLFDNDEDSV